MENTSLKFTQILKVVIKKNPNQIELSSVTVEHLSVEQMATAQETHHTFLLLN